MNNNLNSEQKHDIKIFGIVSIVMIISCVLVLISNKNESKKEAFRNSEILVCYDTLIVSDTNWKLVADHLINNNSAGYLDIEKCKIKK